MTNIDNLISINRYVRIPQAWTGAKTTFIYEKIIFIYNPINNRHVAYQKSRYFNVFLMYEMLIYLRNVYNK
jgi:hypothetical protein